MEGKELFIPITSHRSYVRGPKNEKRKEGRPVLPSASEILGRKGGGGKARGKSTYCWEEGEKGRRKGTNGQGGGKRKVEWSIAIIPSSVQKEGRRKKGRGESKKKGFRYREKRKKGKRERGIDLRAADLYLAIIDNISPWCKKKEKKFGLRRRGEKEEGRGTSFVPILHREA